MATFNNDIDIDPCDYIYECSKYEIKELIQELEDHGYIKPNSSLDKPLEPNIHDSEWTDMLLKILENKHQVSLHDEELILKIFKKIV
jgi:hypothetical protein